MAYLPNKQHESTQIIYYSFPLQLLQNIRWNWYLVSDRTYSGISPSSNDNLSAFASFAWGLIHYPNLLFPGGLALSERSESNGLHHGNSSFGNALLASCRTSHHPLNPVRRQAIKHHLPTDMIGPIIFCIILRKLELHLFKLKQKTDSFKSVFCFSSLFHRLRSLCHHRD